MLFNVHATLVKICPITTTTFDGIYVFLQILCLADAEPLSERSLNFGRETKENYISVFSLQLTADLDIYEWISVNKVRP